MYLEKLIGRRDVPHNFVNDESELARKLINNKQKLIKEKNGYIIYLCVNYDESNGFVIYINLTKPN